LLIPGGLKITANFGILDFGVMYLRIIGGVHGIMTTFSDCVCKF